MKHLMPWLVLGLVGCGQTSTHSETSAAPERVTHAAVHEPTAVASTPSPAKASAEPWSRRTVPEGPDHALARRGLELANDTHRLLPDDVGNGLNCTSCHLEDAQRPKAAPWVGVSDRYPRYRKRSGRVDDLPDRINGCMTRSMNGQALAKDSEAMRAFVAYMDFLSEGVDGKALPDVGMPKIQAPAPADPERGKQLFEARCVACHQIGGQGVYGPDDRTLFPPLWGARSYNIGAGMARLDTATAFVKWNMPQGLGGTLTDQEAHDIASYFIFEDRPDLPGKENDWPEGGKPRDARY